MDFVRLNQERVSQQFLIGYINFCTFMPMHSIPFQVVCFLGMNDGVYPRILSTIKFDLMTQQSRLGNRNRRNDDRYLFLEVLLSAQQKFYISFIGYCVHDNTIHSPLVLVSELSDYITRSFYLLGDEHNTTTSSANRVRLHICQWHSRLPFSPENFSADNKNQSFTDEWLSIVKGKNIQEETL